LNQIDLADFAFEAHVVPALFNLRAVDSGLSHADAADRRRLAINLRDDLPSALPYNMRLNEKEGSMKRFALVLLLLVCCVPLASAQSTCTLTFQTESLPGFTVGSPSNFQIEGVSGTEPYTFTLVDGVFPAGLHLNKHGKITGVASEVADTTVFIKLTDAAGCEITQAFAVRSNAP
jgi:hypothetical protein